MPWIFALFAVVVIVAAWLAVPTTAPVGCLLGHDWIPTVGVVGDHVFATFQCARCGRQRRFFTVAAGLLERPRNRRAGAGAMARPLQRCPAAPEVRQRESVIRVLDRYGSVVATARAPWPASRTPEDQWAIQTTAKIGAGLLRDLADHIARIPTDAGQSEVSPK